MEFYSDDPKVLYIMLAKAIYIIMFEEPVIGGACILLLGLFFYALACAFVDLMDYYL